MPLVAVQGGPGEGVPVVAVDQHDGAAAATRHLLGLGHPTVHHIAGPRESLEAGQREQAWSEALSAAGAPKPAVRRGDWGAPSGYAHGRELAADPGVTAVFVANDQMALGLLRAMHEAGRRIPEDVSVVGFDDIPEAPYFTPPLTTVRQDFGELGSLSLRILLQTVEASRTGAGAPRGSTVAPLLTIRASTGPYTASG